MTTREHQTLLAEATELQRMLENTPEDFAIDRLSLEARIEEVQAELHGKQSASREPAHSVLTFSGRPVLRSHGILADFGAKAVNQFTDAVAMLAASLRGPLRAAGPIPDRESNRILITNIATGSFGFELEEDLSQSELATDEPSAIEQAFESLRELLESTVGTDDDLTEKLADVDARVVRTLQEYLGGLADAEALCAFEFRDQAFRFRDVGQVRRSAARLSEDNVHEEERTLAGQFEGAVPHHRRFEFQRSDTGDLVYGKVDPGVEDADRINDIRHRPVEIRVLARWVGEGRPRYTLLELPDVTPDASASG